MIAPAILMLAVNIGLLSAWAIVAPRRYAPVFDDSFDRWGRRNHYEMKCISSGQYDWIFPVLLFAWNCCVLFAANYQAFKARSIQTEFGESRFIGLIMAFILQIGLIAVPVRMQTDMARDLRYLTWSLLVLTVSGATLFILFIPKVIALGEHQAVRRERERIRELRLAGDDIEPPQQQTSEGRRRSSAASRPQERSEAPSNASVLALSNTSASSAIGTFVVRKTKRESFLGVTRVSGFPGHQGEDSTTVLSRKRKESQLAISRVESSYQSFKEPDLSSSRFNFSDRSRKEADLSSSRFDISNQSLQNDASDPSKEWQPAVHAAQLEVVGEEAVCSPSNQPYLDE